MTAKVVRELLRAVLLALPLAVYLVLPTRNYYWDGVAFALDIEKHAPVAQLLHPNHLFYALFGSGLYALAPHTRALFLMQRANSVLGAACVFLFYRILRRFDAPGAWSVVGALLFAFSATWWKFSTDADAYVPSIFFLLIAFLLLDEYPVLAGLATAAAMLCHELAIFFLPIAWMRLRSGRAKYSIASLAPVAIAYLAACHVVFGRIRVAELWRWMVSHSPDSGFSFAPLRDGMMTIRGTLRLVFGGKPDALAGGGFTVLVLAAMIIATPWFAIAVWRARANYRFAAPPAIFAAWVGIYAAFLFFWMPQNTFYRLFYLPALIAGGILVFRRMPGIQPVALLVAVMSLWNLAFEIYPQSRAETNAPLEFAMLQHDDWAPGTPVVFYRFYPDLWLISYFNPQVPWMALEQLDMDRLNRDLEYAHRVRKPLWLEADAYNLIAENEAGRAWLAEHERPLETIEYRDAKHDFRFYCVR